MSSSLCALGASFCFASFSSTMSNTKATTDSTCSTPFNNTLLATSMSNAKATCFGYFRALWEITSTSRSSWDFVRIRNRRFNIYDNKAKYNRLNEICLSYYHNEWMVHHNRELWLFLLHVALGYD